MADNVSSEVLFHFTPEFHHLKSILKDGFFPHYCPEYSLDPEDQRRASRRKPPLRAIPLVSFCDLPDSLIHNHINEYCGEREDRKFGIGLGKDWGIRNGISPVTYTHKNAQTQKPIKNLSIRAAHDEDRSSTNDLNLLSAYTKSYRGYAWRHGRRSKEKATFYDEREWRYVPIMNEPETPFLSWDQFKNKTFVNRLHSRFKRQFALPIPR